MPEKAIAEMVEHGKAGMDGYYIHKKKRKYISIGEMLKDAQDIKE